MIERKRVQRSRTDKKVAGICGGLANYFEIDPVIIRLIFLLFLFLGPGLLTYIIAWFVIPLEPKKIKQP